MIDAERLLACALGELPEAENAEVEEHVLACASCAERFASLLRLGGEIAALVRAGAVTMPVTPALLAKLEAEHLITRRYTLVPGASLPCTVDAEDVLSMVELRANLAGVERVDLWRGPHRIVDVPFEPDRVVAVTSADLLRTFPSMTFPLKLVAVTPDGERVLAEYTLEHTAFAP